MGNKRIAEISIQSDHLSKLMILPVHTPYTLICSTSAIRRLELICGLELAMCGPPLKSLELSVERCEILFTDGTMGRFINGHKNQQKIMTHEEFKHKVLGIDCPFDSIRKHINDQQYSNNIKRITGLKLYERLGILLIDMQGRKIPILTLSPSDLEFIKIQIRFYDMQKGLISFLILTREALSMLNDEARTKVFLDILNLPAENQCIILCEPLDTLGVPFDGLKSPKIIELDDK